jgi:Protein of unknown function (DUF2442)
MAKAPLRIAAAPLTDRAYARGRKTFKKRSFDVVGARYDRRSDVLELSLRRGVVVRLPRKQIRELASARPCEVATVEVQPGGDGISFPPIDVDISVSGLLADVLGSLFATAMARKARGKSSPQKAAASRKNGRKGGRPRKQLAA